jgi:hypothetical protein
MSISLESTAARPSLWINRTAIALRSKSVKKRVMPLRGFSGSRSLVRARRRTFVACWALVVHTLRPLTMKRSPRRSARVCMREVSVPALGSVTPNAITVSPVQIEGRCFRFIASVPYLITGVGGNT